jgi:hypothetical protein
LRGTNNPHLSSSATWGYPGLSRRALPYAVSAGPDDLLAAPCVGLAVPLGAPCAAAAGVPCRSEEFAWMWGCSGHQRSMPLALWAAPLRPMWSAPEGEKCFDVRSFPFPFLQHVSRPRGRIEHIVGPYCLTAAPGNLAISSGAYVDLDQTNTEDLSIEPPAEASGVCALIG